ncbi:MAG: SAM-dependent methyltransferase [Thermoplasmata archaeon]|nr:SAM-dependent methyltransferase [Thermoplasmata archaeon]
MAEAGHAPHRPSEGLAHLIQRWCDPDGFLPFDRYWELAQFDEEEGYYARLRSPIGTAGDFYTAPSVGSFFGWTIADHLFEGWVELGRPSPFCFAEIGGGEGQLAADVIERLAERRPESAEWEFRFVERSRRRRARAVERLRPIAERGGMQLTVPESLGEGGPFAGSVVANELLDALPARRLRRCDGGWEELGVLLDRGKLVPGSRPLTRPVTGPPLPELPEGAVYEFSPEAEGIVREVADSLLVGRAVFLDYGALETHWTRTATQGTVVALRSHAALADPLAEPGRSDLSSWVNFTRVRAAARTAGMVERLYLPQREALVAWGLPQRVEELAAAGSQEADRVRVRLQSKQLLVRFENFQVLELGNERTAG